ncbi:hypothetical protein VHEMI09918 [[Torrubiella] hemipterigena]|uniref:Uncharacterized protein n=1 Tax=[Torrubiella] hemipterigena TaxID=1531966 RepID=A0A0A1TBE1_9HYPO|nr:hypothetical protein VHEMI09918 [[Torrubiella] hemipterigena]
MKSAILATVGLLAVAHANPVVVKRNVLKSALPENADDTEKKFQPLVDFDKDGCYNTAAIDPDGNVNEGHKATGTPQGDCRDPHQLENSNTYSRKRCNNGYCAVMYEYYFEKDQSVGGSFAGGHRHDWENVVVFSKGDNIVRVAPSCHGHYKKATNSPLKDGTHPQVVYHKDGPATHCFRIANDGDVKEPENYSGHFYRSPLVGWGGYPSDKIKNKMLSNWSGGVGPKLDDEFEGALRDAAGDGVPGFDPSKDE